MKIRNGFVSNSSSSSFIVAFQKSPKYQHEVEDTLFHSNIRGISSPYNDMFVDCRTAAKLIWDQIKDQKPLTKSQIFEEITSGYFEGYPNTSYSSEDDPSWRISNEYTKLTKKSIHDEDANPKWKKKYNDAWKKYYDDRQTLIDLAAKELMEREYPMKFKGKKAYRVVFSDNDGNIFATLEHGNTFDAVPHIRVSHH